MSSIYHYNVITHIDAETGEIHLDENYQIISKKDALARPVS